MTYLWGLEGGRVDKLEQRLSGELARQPEKRLLKVVVGLGANVVVLQVLLPVECNLLGLDLAVLHVDLVPAQHHGDVLAHAHQVTVPVGNVLVRHASSHVEHDNGALEEASEDDGGAGAGDERGGVRFAGGACA